MQKRYSKEFKETLIAFYHSGQSVTQLSKEYDVAPATIYKWIDLTLNLMKAPSLKLIF